MSGVSDQGGSHKKFSNSLVALSSAAVLAVYTAGYLRTKPAADRFAIQAAARRPTMPAPPVAAPVSSPAPQESVAMATPPPTKSAASPDEKSSVPVTRLTRGAPRSTVTARKPTRVASPTAAPETTSAITPVAAPKAATETTSANAAVAAPKAAAETPSATAASPVPAAPPAVVERSEPAQKPTVAEPPKPQYKDGTYLGWGTSRHGDIQAQVVITGGRIASATIAQCLTRYDCSVIARLPPQVAQRQSPETDYVSGATQSTNAFYYAVVEALSKAK
jgi:uncharacterized protein with FMN-binding domain